MKREEALEYMNRYLDHDLSQEETDALFRHLGDSPEAQEDFDFLKSLSDKLESLPDVKPPISLVDSILPRLDEIDRLASTATPQFQQETLSEMESKRMLGEEAPKRRKAAAFWRSTLGRTVGGTAVAAAVLGIFVATYEPTEMPNAEVTSSTAVTGAADPTLVPSNGTQVDPNESVEVDPSTEVEPIQPQTQLEPEDSQLRQNKQTESSASSALEEEATTDEPTTNDSNETQDTQTDSLPQSRSQSTQDNGNAGATQTQPNAGSSSSDTSSEQPSAKTDPPKTATPKSEPAAGADTPSSSKPTDSTKSQPATEGTKDPSTSVESKPPASPPVTNNESDEAADSAEGQPNEGISTFSLGDTAPNSRESASAGESNPNPEADAMDSQAYSMMAAPLEWGSPDGTYVVTYSQNVLKLLKGDRSSELNTRKVDGDVTGGVWSADGKTFTYDLIKADGTIVQGTWKIEEVKLEQGGK